MWPVVLLWRRPTRHYVYVPTWQYVERAKKLYLLMI